MKPATLGNGFVERPRIEPCLGVTVWQNRVHRISSQSATLHAQFGEPSASAGAHRSTRENCLEPRYLRASVNATGGLFEVLAKAEFDQRHSPKPGGTAELRKKFVRWAGLSSFRVAGGERWAASVCNV